ncbi:MAG: PEP-CTERM sorting domain-containing protein [Phycisphaerales bacterium]|nr:PEP-CTERM sorting domain-containing protein [Phycisphaerales bacterium]
MNRRFAIAALVSGAAASAAIAQVIDGTRDASYGAPIAIQTVQTQFGDANPPGNLGGSELDAAYARIENGRLYIMLTGNHEPNFNKLDVFFDSAAGGENTLSGTPQYDFFNGSAWISQNFAGMTFDAGFTADYHLFSRWGSGNGQYEVDFINRQGGANAQVPGSHGNGNPAIGLISTGTILAGNIGPNASGSALTQNLQFAINDNNTGGVTGGNGPADQNAAAAVTTGMEFSIALADLGSPADGEVIKIAAMINNGDHNYLSNQFLGGLPGGTGNLGGDGNGGFTGTLGGVNLNNFEGLQFFTITVPEPASIALLGLAGVALLRRR